MEDDIKNNKIGEESYINHKCWLVNNLGQRTLPRCKYCDIRWRDCFLIHFFLASAVIFAALLIPLYFFDFDIIKYLSFSFLIIFVVYGYLVNRETDKLVDQRFALWKANKDLKQLDGYKSEFITITAHQLRTPLSVIKWSLNSFLNGELGEISARQKEAIKKADDSNNNLIALVNELLEVKKAEGDTWGYEFEKKPIEIIARNVLEDFYQMAKAKRINLILEKPETSIPDVNVDSGKINIVFKVLIENALHYSPEGSDIGVKFENLENCIKVAIKDQGIGIPDEEKKRVFSSFFRGKEALRKRTEGSGIGLYMVKNIIESHQGKIWFESEKDKGSAFYFTIPFGG